MKAELVVLGIHFDMKSRSRRRVLVLFTYLGLGVALYCMWRWVGWSFVFSWGVLVALLINGMLFGGLSTGGLVRPFSRNLRPIWWYCDPPQSRIDLWFWSRAQKLDLKTDEREDAQRDRAHYLAYRVLSLILGVLLFLIYDAKLGQIFGDSISINFPLAVALGGFLIALTLPQAILLWTEPDMELDPLTGDH